MKDGSIITGNNNPSTSTPGGVTAGNEASQWGNDVGIFYYAHGTEKTNFNLSGSAEIGNLALNVSICGKIPRL